MSARFEPNLKCGYCNTPFYRAASKLKSKTGIYFCSREHQGLAFRKDSGIAVSSGPKPVATKAIAEQKGCKQCNHPTRKPFCSDDCRNLYLVEITEKKCLRCMKTKELTEFHNAKSTFDNKNSKCKQCISELFLLKEKPCPKGCGEFVKLKAKACRKCHAKERGEKANDQTLSDLISRNKGNKGKIHADSVRWLARSQHKDTLLACYECGYTEHVDMCHIKDVQFFSLETTIREINSASNVVALCKLHHWEFDNGYLFTGLDSSSKPVTNKKATKVFYE